MQYDNSLTDNSIPYNPPASPTDSTDSHGYYSVGLTKTDIHPLKRMEAEPGVRLPLYSYKNEFLTPKP